jgi:translation initiation factor IF-2
MGGEVLDVEVSAKKAHRPRQAARSHHAPGRNPRPQGQSEPRTAEGTVIEAKLDRWPRLGRHRARPEGYAERSARSSSPATNGAACARWSTIAASRYQGSRSPAMPVEVLGFRARPRKPGDRFAVAENEAAPARSPNTVSARSARRPSPSPAGKRGSLEQMMAQLKSLRPVKEFPLVIKGDVQGSDRGDHRRARQARHRRSGGPVSSIRASAPSPSPTLSRWPNASGAAAIIGFNVRANPQARELSAENAGIEYPLLQHHLRPRG